MVYLNACIYTCRPLLVKRDTMLVLQICVYKDYEGTSMHFVLVYFCRPNSFAIYTANRIYDFVADSSGEMHMWIGALSPKKFSLGDDDILSTCLMKGQPSIAYRMVPTAYKRWNST